MFKLIESYEENGGKGQIKLACVIKNIIIILLHVKCPEVLLKARRWSKRKTGWIEERKPPHLDPVNLTTSLDLFSLNLC